MQFSYDAKAHKLHIVVDCSPERIKAARNSKSNKTRLLDTTGSFVAIGDAGAPEGLKAAVNVTLPVA